MRSSELKRTTGVLHHARWSFRAMADIMVDERPELDAEYDQLRFRVIRRLWVPFEITRFFATSSPAWDWTTWHDYEPGVADR